MKIPLILMYSIVLVMFCQTQVSAQKQLEKPRKIEKKERPNKVEKPNRVKKVERTNRANNPKTVVTTRPPRVQYPRNQFPRTKVVVVKPRVKTITVLAPDHTRIVYRGRPYYYQGGRYYHYINNGYTIIAPPRGIRIGFLPIGYRPIFVGNVQNYYYMGAYYRPIGNEFEAFEPNVGTIVPDLPQDNVEEVIIDGQVYYECNDILYKAISTSNGTEYEVVGKLSD
jgi:hypothetical protein